MWLKSLSDDERLVEEPARSHGVEAAAAVRPTLKRDTSTVLDAGRYPRAQIGLKLGMHTGKVPRPRAKKKAVAG